MERDAILADIRRHKSALNRAEQIIAQATPEGIALLRQVLASCSGDEIEVLRSVLTKNDSSPTSVNGDRQAALEANPHALSAAHRPLTNGKATLVRAVEQAVELFDVITSPLILGYLEKQHFKFGNNYAISGVSAVLRKLAERGKLVEIAKGSGQQPTQYRKAGGGPPRN
jgi:hypothetical protein